MTTATIETLDARGLSCPMPILMTAKRMKEVRAGQTVEVLATDPGSVSDFEAWARATGNILVSLSADDGLFRYVIQKR